MRGPTNSQRQWSDIAKLRIKTTPQRNSLSLNCTPPVKASPGTISNTSFGHAKLPTRDTRLRRMRLATFTSKGEEFPEDDQQAAAWFRKAADQGYAFAQFSLGAMYANGRGVPEDDQQAVAWYRKAAEYGLPDARYSLGLAYETGRGVPQDLTLAVEPQQVVLG